MIDLFGKLRLDKNRSRVRRDSAVGGTRRLALERMEDRLVLSTATAVNSLDVMPATVVATQSNPAIQEGGWIDFQGLLDAGDLQLLAQVTAANELASQGSTAVYIVSSTSIGIGYVGLGGFVLTGTANIRANFDFDSTAGDVVVPNSFGNGNSHFSDSSSDHLNSGPVILLHAGTWRAIGLEFNDIARINQPSTNPDEGGGVPIENIVAQKHPAIPGAASELPATLVRKPVVPTSIPAASERREITGTQARDVAIEVAYVEGMRSPAPGGGVMQLAASRVPTSNSAASNRMIQPAANSGEETAIAQRAATSAGAGETHHAADKTALVAVEGSEGHGRRATEAMVAATGEGSQAVDAVMETAGRQIASRGEAYPFSDRLDDAELEIASDVAQPLRDREQGAEPWHILVTLVASTWIAQRLSRRQTETEIHPPRRVDSDA